MTDAINALINVCTATAPGQKECDSALRKIEAVKAMLESPNEAVNDATFFECLEAVMDKSKVFCCLLYCEMHPSNIIV